VTLKMPSRLTPSTASHCSLVIFRRVVSCVMPALLTRMSMGPRSFSMSSMSFWQPG